MPGPFRRSGADPDVLAHESASRPAGGTPAMPRNLISRALTWMTAGLALQGDALPRELGAGAVVPMVDVAGGLGWAFASYATLNGAFATTAGTIAYYIVTPDSVNTQLLLSLQMNQQTVGPVIPAQRGEIGIAFPPPADPPSGAFKLVGTGGPGLPGGTAGFMLPAGVTASIYLPSIVGGLKYVIAPPGYGIYVEFFSNPGTVTQFAQGLVATIPGVWGAGR